MGDKYTDSSPLEYLQREKDTGAILIHNESIRLLERMLTYLAENGEPKPSTLLRNMLLKRVGPKAKLPFSLTSFSYKLSLRPKTFKFV